MALADYKLCDKCGQKAFYDSNLNYDFGTRNDPIPKEEMIRGEHVRLDYLGDWSVICRRCAEKYVCVIVDKQPPVSGEKP